MMNSRWKCFSWLAAGLLVTMGRGMSEDSATNLARKTQNPVSDLISLPFQNNLSTGIGFNDDVQNILNIQPVLPISLNDSWNLINRTVLPVVYQPELEPGFGDEFGLGDMTHSMFFSPRDTGSLIWGVGPVIEFPTATHSSLGAGEWGLGPTAVALIMPGHWVVGALASNIWSLGNDEVNFGLLQYFINYNLSDGWYLTSAPIHTVDWNAPGGEQWTVPLGMGLGKVHAIGGQPVNLSAHAYYNVERPTLGAEWQFRLQVQLLFPK